MADLDDETLERVKQWCAAAGRHAGVEEIRAALSPLGWDELLHVRALLADPPPARPLGPAALADLARGTPADVAAEREREGRYKAESEPPSSPPEASTEPGALPRPAPRARTRGPRRPAAPVVHRLRDRPEAAPPPSPVLPSIDELRREGGRAVLQQLIREHGARRAFLLAALAGWRRPDGTPPGDDDLTALLDQHGLVRAFEHRERDELIHALRVARGDTAAAALALKLPPEEYRGALARLGAAEDAERIREERRAELRSLATLGERSRLLAQDAPRLADLGILAELEADLRARLPEHLRALAASGTERLPAALARSMSLQEEDALALVRRLGVDLGAGSSGPRPPRQRREYRTGPRRSGAPGPRGAGPRGAGPRGAGPRGAGPRGAGPRGAGPRGAGPRGAGPRGAGPRGAGPRGAGPRGAGPRGAGPRGAGPRGAGPRGAGPRGAGPRGAGPRKATAETPPRRRKPTDR